MKTNKYQRRFYRDWAIPRRLFTSCIRVKETDLQILTDKPVEKDLIIKQINSYRQDIEKYISRDRRFLTALKPIALERNAPKIVQEMGRASQKANVGPMAAVAGALAEFLGRYLIKRGYKDIIIENGGDIFLKTTKTCSIGIYTGNLKKWQGLRLKIKPQDTPLGVCTSSGKVGHSLSFGLADAVVISASNASLADAIATATANRVKSKLDLAKAIDFARSLKGIRGVLIIFKNNLIGWGKLEFVK